MTALRNNLGKKAAKAAVRHSWRGVASKSRRQPLRSSSLLTVGGLVGLLTGWFAGRKTSQADQ